MKQHKKINIIPVKTITVTGILISVIVFMNFGFKNKSTVSNEESMISNKDSVESVKAFMKVYEVLMSPRCMNCHPSGDIPLQGDESRLHAMNPKRGKRW